MEMFLFSLFVFVLFGFSVLAEDEELAWHKKYCEAKKNTDKAGNGGLYFILNWPFVLDVRFHC